MSLTIPQAFRSKMGLRAFNRMMMSLPGFVAGWDMQEPAGTVIHDIGGNYNGTASATGLTYGATGPVINREFARGMGFDGVGGKVNFGLPIVDSAQTISIISWVNISALTSDQYPTIIDNTKSNTSRLAIQTLVNGISATFNNGTTSYPASGPTTTGWHNIAICKNTGNVAPLLYIDSIVQSGTTPGLTANGNKLMFGSRTDGLRLFAGTIAPIYIYNQALPANTIAYINACANGGIA